MLHGFSLKILLDKIIFDNYFTCEYKKRASSVEFDESQSSFVLLNLSFKYNKVMAEKNYEAARVSPDQLNVADFWSRHESDIRQELASEYQKYFSLFSEYPEDDKQEELASAFQREQFFVELLLPKLRDILSQEEKTLMLVDIDETIANIYYRNNEPLTVIRPSFIKILESLESLRQAGKIDVGLLTSRGLLQDQLEDPNHLKKLKPFINPQHIYSTRDNRSEGDTIGELKGLAELEDSVLKPGLTEAAFSGFRTMGDVEKLMTLTKVSRENPHTSILTVDDFPYVNYLNSQKKLYGLLIDRKAVFRIR